MNHPYSDTPASSSTPPSTRPVVAILTWLERFVPPWLASLVAGVLTLVTQLHSFISSQPVPVGYLDALSRLAANDDLFSLLPAPVAAIITYLIRRTPAPRPQVAASTSAAPAAVPTAAQQALARQSFLTSDVDQEQTLRIPPAGENTRVRSMPYRVEQLQSEMLMLRREVERQGGSLRVYERCHAKELDDLLTRISLLEIQSRSLRLDTNEIRQIQSPAPAKNTAQAPPSRQPLNIRQNNPLNIESTAQEKTPWRGERASTTRYAVFDSPVSGIRAAAYLLVIVYFLRHDLRTIASIIERWSPRGDNTDEEVDQYIARVSQAMNTRSDAILSLDSNARQLVAMIRAMGEVEGGQALPYPIAVFYQGIALLPDEPARILALKRSAQAWMQEYSYSSDSQIHPDFDLATGSNG